MKYELKLLFIGIALSFFIGNIFSNVLFTPEVGEASFGTWTETAYLYQITPELEEDSYSEYSIPSSQNAAHTPRHTSKSKRTNHSSSYMNGLSFLKGKEHKDSYTSPLFTDSNRRFSSGMNEAKQNLIYFGRLII